MAQTKLSRFECSGCRLFSERKTKKRPTWCDDCSKARSRFLSVISTNDNYPRKSCKGCGVHMSNLEYGKAQFCAECAEVRVRRHKGWSDPYATGTRLLFAANDNRPQRKICLSCECELPLDAFHKHATGGLGVSAECKECRAILRSERGREEEYERRQRIRGKSTGKNKRIRLIERWNKRHIKRTRDIGRRIDKYLNVFYKPWNKPGLTEAEKYRLRYAKDNEFMLRERTRRRLRRKGFGFDAMWRMRRALNGQEGEVGTATIEAALGYSMTDLRAHLQSQFTGGMSWGEFRSGRIHIDHKRALSRFDLSDPAQVLEAWSLNNLQPLWAQENMAKGAKTDEEWRAAA